VAGGGDVKKQIQILAPNKDEPKPCKKPPPPVETKSHGTGVPQRSCAYEYAQKNVTWKDALFPRQQPTSSPSPRTAK